MIKVVVPGVDKPVALSQLQIVKNEEETVTLSKMKGTDQIFNGTDWEVIGYPSDIYCCMGYPETIVNANIDTLMGGKSNKNIPNSNLVVDSGTFGTVTGGSVGYQVQEVDLIINGGTYSGPVYAGNNFNTLPINNPTIKISSIINDGSFSSFAAGNKNVTSSTDITQNIELTINGGNFISIYGGPFVSSRAEITGQAVVNLTKNPQGPNCIVYGSGAIYADGSISGGNIIVNVGLEENDPLTSLIYAGGFISSGSILPNKVTLNLNYGMLGAWCFGGSNVSTSAATFSAPKNIEVNVGSKTGNKPLYSDMTKVDGNNPLYIQGAGKGSGSYGQVVVNVNRVDSPPGMLPADRNYVSIQGGGKVENNQNQTIDKITINYDNVSETASIYQIVAAGTTGWIEAVPDSASTTIGEIVLNLKQGYVQSLVSTFGANQANCTVTVNKLTVNATGGKYQTLNFGGSGQRGAVCIINESYINLANIEVDNNCLIGGRSFSAQQSFFNSHLQIDGGTYVDPNLADSSNITFGGYVESTNPASINHQSNMDTVINGGTFNKSIFASAYAAGGTFDFAANSKINTTINNGTFNYPVYCGGLVNRNSKITYANGCVITNNVYGGNYNDNAHFYGYGYTNAGGTMTGGVVVNNIEMNNTASYNTRWGLGGINNSGTTGTLAFVSTTGNVKNSRLSSIFGANINIGTPGNITLNLLGGNSLGSIRVGGLFGSGLNGDVTGNIVCNVSGVNQIASLIGGNYINSTASTASTASIQMTVNTGTTFSNSFIGGSQNVGGHSSDGTIDVTIEDLIHTSTFIGGCYTTTAGTSSANISMLEVNNGTFDGLFHGGHYAIGGSTVTGGATNVVINGGNFNATATLGHRATEQNTSITMTGENAFTVNNGTFAVQSYGAAFTNANSSVTFEGPVTINLNGGSFNTFYCLGYVYDGSTLNVGTVTVNLNFGNETVTSLIVSGTLTSVTNPGTLNITNLNTNINGGTFANSVYCGSLRTDMVGATINVVVGETQKATFTGAGSLYCGCYNLTRISTINSTLRNIDVNSNAIFYGGGRVEASTSQVIDTINCYCGLNSSDVITGTSLYAGGQTTGADSSLDITNINLNMVTGTFSGNLASVRSDGGTTTIGTATFDLAGGTVQNFQLGGRTTTTTTTTTTTVNATFRDGFTCVSWGCGGGYTNAGGTNHVENVNLNIEGGTFTSNLIGGGYANGGPCTVGTVTINISGGTFNLAIYGGGGGIGDLSTEAVVDKTFININAPETGTITFKGGLYSGGYQLATVTTSTTINISGNCSNIVWPISIYGTSSGSTTITPTRLLSFNGATGTLTSYLYSFSTIRFGSNTNVTLQPEAAFTLTNHFAHMEWVLSTGNVPFVQFGSNVVGNLTSKRFAISTNSITTFDANIADGPSAFFTNFSALRGAYFDNVVGAYDSVTNTWNSADGHWHLTVVESATAGNSSLKLTYTA